MLLGEVAKGNEGVLDYSYDLWHLESEEVKKVYEEERNIARARNGIKTINQIYEHQSRTS